MGRKSHSRSLSLWANRVRVGTWTQPSRGESQLRYDSGWLCHELCRPLSLSLPLPLSDKAIQGVCVDNFFDNLLPERDSVRKRLARKFGAPSTEPFDLLRMVGRDCAGALQVLGVDETPGEGGIPEGISLSAEDVERQLSALVAPDMFGLDPDEQEAPRFALAGAQLKTALLWHQGQWHLPRGTAPTTHIFKMPMGRVGRHGVDFSASVDNEWICLRLLRAMGLPVADARIETFGAQRVLVVDRFDRLHTADGRWLRLPHEDICQATGTSPLLKYERDGGPGLKDLASLLQQSSEAARDIDTLLAAQVLFWMLRAPDAHAKNFSLHLQRGGAFRLAPLYDVLSAWPVIGPNSDQWDAARVSFAMAMPSGHARMGTMSWQHFVELAVVLGRPARLSGLVESLLTRVASAMEAVRAEAPAGVSSQVMDSILTGFQQSALDLSAMRPG